MPINYEQLLAMKNFGQRYSYGDREAMLYAYAIGMGSDPLDERELAFVNEATATARPLLVVPSFASVAAWDAGPGEMSLNRVMVVDGERDISFHRPLSTAADITAESSVLAAFDKGKAKGAVIQHQTVLKSAGGELLATIVASLFARGDGGFGGPSVGQPEPHQVPTRAPDLTLDISTRPDPTRHSATACAGTATRCTRIRSSPNAPAFPDRFCTVCVPMGLLVAAFCRLTPIMIPLRSSAMRHGFPRPSIPARP